MINLRTARENDAEKYLALMLTLDRETMFMLYKNGERKSSAEDLKKLIEQSIISNSLLLFVEDNGGLIGFLSATRGHTRKIEHRAYIVIGILKAYQGKGVGKSYLRAFHNSESLSQR